MGRSNFAISPSATATRLCCVTSRCKFPLDRAWPSSVPPAAARSTLVNLITRLYEAPEGSLLIDGRPVRDYPLAVLRRNIGMVPQETFLFSETIRENLAFGAPHADAEQLLEAAEAAHIRNGVRGISAWL